MSTLVDKCNVYGDCFRRWHQKYSADYSTFHFVSLIPVHHVSVHACYDLGVTEFCLAAILSITIYFVFCFSSLGFQFSVYLSDDYHSVLFSLLCFFVSFSFSSSSLCHTVNV